MITDPAKKEKPSQISLKSHNLKVHCTIKSLKDEMAIIGAGKLFTMDLRAELVLCRKHPKAGHLK